MKIGDFPLVEAMMATRNRLIDLRDEGHIRIEIDGAKMQPDFVEAVTPAIHLELRNRIIDIHGQLRRLGVVID